MLNKSSCTKGFTLIELLVVVLIIGILASIALPQYKKAVEKTHTAEAKIILNKVRQLHQLCVLEQGANPCDDSYVTFVSDYLQGELPGEYEDNVDNCPAGDSACFKTKNWTYETDDMLAFRAARNMSGTYPYVLYIQYEDGVINCYNNDSDAYCTMLCGRDGCVLK